MILVGVDALFEIRLTALSVPDQLTVVDILQHEAQLPHLRLQRLDAVCLLDLQGREPCKMEGDALGGTGHDERLCQVGRIHKVILQLRHATAILGQSHRLGDAHLLGLKLILHAKQTEDISCHGVALLRAVHQA